MLLVVLIYEILCVNLLNQFQVKTVENDTKTRKTKNSIFLKTINRKNHTLLLHGGNTTKHSFSGGEDKLQLNHDGDEEEKR